MMADDVKSLKESYKESLVSADQAVKERDWDRLDRYLFRVNEYFAAGNKETADLIRPGDYEQFCGCGLHGAGDQILENEK